SNNIKPFLRWAGGKKWLVPHISNFIPKNFKIYHEIFLGGGSIFFYLIENKKAAFLSDINEELINAYLQLRTNPTLIIKKMKKHINNEEYFYNLRKKTMRSHVQSAAQFIFLNKTSFNGIYRVNRNGTFNVPYGHRNDIELIDESLLLSVSNNLKLGSINCLD